MLRVTSLRAALVALILLLIAPATLLAAPEFPALTGRVVDNAGVLAPATKAELTARLETLEARTGRQLVVVTLKSIDGYPIEDYGYQLGRHWGIGHKGKNDGILFIIVPPERQVRIEVGYGLEPIVTDALSSVILQEKVLPRFRAGDYSGGIVAGTSALVEQLSLDAPEAKQRALAAKRKPHSGKISPFLILFVIFVVISIFRVGFGRRSGLGLLLPLLILNGGRGGWGGGGGGSWGGGGGGFSGGGGSFGGGGASGRW